MNDRCGKRNLCWLVVESAVEIIRLVIGNAFDLYEIVCACGCGCGRCRVERGVVVSEGKMQQKCKMGNIHLPPHILSGITPTCPIQRT